MRFSAGKVHCEFASGQADLTKTFDIFLAIAPWAVTGSLSWSWSPHRCPFAQIVAPGGSWGDLLLCGTGIHRHNLCCGAQEGKGIPTLDVLFCLH